MDYGYCAFSTPESMEHGNRDKPLVVTNCGFYVAHNKKHIFDKGFNEADNVLVYQHRGKSYLPMHDVHVSEGHVFLLHPSERQLVHYSDDEINERYFVYFTGAQTENYLNQMGLHNKKSFYTGVSDTLVSYFTDIREDFKVHDFSTDIFRTLLLLKILEFVHEKNSPKTVSDEESEDIKTVISHMEKNYYDKITLEECAKLINTSVPSLIRHFKKHTNTTPINYLKKIRLNNAEFLLSTSDMPINEIAQQVGFDDPLHFSKFFKAKTGLSPADYKKNH